MTGRRVVIVGIGSHWGAELARRLERDPGIEYLGGIDIEGPPADLERTDFIEADIRSPLLSRLLPGTEADTIVHCGILWYP
jgi:UDP-glucose 4-epimerase